jgi:two-component system, NarL family, nitrate/nitrite response regulator NarL
MQSSKRVPRSSGKRAMFAKLTPREREVARLVSKGYTNVAIAYHLQLSEGTVKLHVHHIFDKLSVLNRTQLALLVTKHEPQ